MNMLSQRLQHFTNKQTHFQCPKKAKLFDFINPRFHGNNTTIDELSSAFIAVADEDMCGRGLQIFNEKRFYALRRLRP